jgi:hypothetical protein
MIGILLIALGLLALVYKGFTYTKERTVLDVGPIEAKVDEKKTVPIAPIVGVVSLAAGVALVLAERRRA